MILNKLRHRGLKAILAGSPWSRVAPTRDLPTIAFFGPGCCCDVAYLSQAFSQPTGPGRLWISLGANLLPDIQFEDDRTKT